MCTYMWSCWSEEEVGVLCHHSSPLLPFSFEMQSLPEPGARLAFRKPQRSSCPYSRHPQCSYICLCSTWVLGSEFFIQVFMLAQQILLLTESFAEGQTTPLGSFTTTNNAKLETRPLTWPLGPVKPQTTV